MRTLILLCLLLPLQAFSATSLWRVSNGENELFLGGTVHVLGKNDYPLPDEFTQAYNAAQMLVLETDLKGINTPEIQAQLLKDLMYSKGETLKQHLKPATYQALEHYLQGIKAPIAAFAQFKPTMVMLTLTIVELDRLKLAGAGVDEFFYKKAVADGKKLGQLESVQKQLTVLANIGKGHEDELILNTLSEMAKLPNMMQDLKAAWRSGDVAKLEALEIAELQKDYPALYQSLLVERNMSWLPEIEAFLNTPEKELILVGALHLAGKDGLLAQLQQRGFKVEPF
jgi:hypothetical protein